MDFKEGQVVWVKRKGDLGAARVTGFFRGYLIVKFLEPGRGTTQVHPRYVEALEVSHV